MYNQMSGRSRLTRHQLLHNVKHCGEKERRGFIILHDSHFSAKPKRTRRNLATKVPVCISTTYMYKKNHTNETDYECKSSQFSFDKHVTSLRPHTVKAAVRSFIAQSVMSYPQEWPLKYVRLVFVTILWLMKRVVVSWNSSCSVVFNQRKNCENCRQLLIYNCVLRFSIQTLQLQLLPLRPSPPHCPWPPLEQQLQHQPLSLEHPLVQIVWKGNRTVVMWPTHLITMKQWQVTNQNSVLFTVFMLCSPNLREKAKELGQAWLIQNSAWAFPYSNMEGQGDVLSLLSSQ